MSNIVRTIVRPTTPADDQKVKVVMESIVALIKAKHLN